MCCLCWWKAFSFDMKHVTQLLQLLWRTSICRHRWHPLQWFKHQASKKKIPPWFSFLLFQFLIISLHITVGIHINDDEENDKGTMGSHAVMHCQMHVAVTLSRLSTRNNPRSCVGFYLLWFLGQYLFVWISSASLFLFLVAIGDDSSSASEGKHWKCYLPVLHGQKVRGKVLLVSLSL